MTGAEQAVLDEITREPAGLAVLTGRLRLHRATVARALATLREAGLIEQTRAGGGRGKTAEYGAVNRRILALETVAKPSQKPSHSAVAETVALSGFTGECDGLDPAEPETVASRAHGVILDLEVQEQTPLPPWGPLPLLPDETSAFDELLQRQLPITAAGTAQTVLGDLIDDARANGVVMTRRVIGMFAKAIKDELDGGATVDQVKAGLALMFARGKVVPSVLSTFVMQASMPKPKPVANPTAMRYGRGMTPAMILDTAPGARELWDAERAKDRAENAAREEARQAAQA